MLPAKFGLKPGDLQAINIAPGAIVDAFRSGEVAAACDWAPHFQRLESMREVRLSAMARTQVLWFPPTWLFDLTISKTT